MTSLSFIPSVVTTQSKRTMAAFLFLCFFLLHRHQQQPILHQRIRSYALQHEHYHSRRGGGSLNANLPFIVQPPFKERNPLHQQTVCFFSTTPSTEHESSKDIKRYLCQETFPLGSFDLRVAADMITAVKKLADKGSPEDVSLVFELLDRLLQEAKFERIKSGTQENYYWNEFVIPKHRLSNVVNAWSLCAYNNTTKVSPRIVFETIKDCQTSFSPHQLDVASYNMIIEAAADSQDPELAEEILDYMINAKQGDVRECANIVSFNYVMNAWAKSGREDAAYKAEDFLRTMIQYSNKGWFEITPDVVSYSIAIKAWANTNHEDAPQRAEDLLHEMSKRGLAPSERSYSSVLMTWARSKKDYAPDRAYAILTNISRLYEKNDTNVKPNTFCCAAVITAYMNNGNAKRAEQTLLEQCERYEMTRDPDLLPNVVSFNSVIHTWSKSGRPEAAQKAEALLQRMQDFATSWNESSLMPETRSFNSVLIAWARSKERDAPYRCEEILQRMNSLYKHRYMQCQPDVVSFGTVLDCWSKSRISEGPERAEAILRHMERLYMAGTGVQPDVRSYNTVMNAWAHSGHPDAVLRAQALFDELLKKYQCDRELKPDLRSFGTLISAWGRTKSEFGAAKAQKVFNDMVALYKAGDKDLQPTKIHYSALLDAWAKAGQPERAENILRKLERAAVKPDISCYNAVINGWAKSRSPDSAQRAQALFDEAVQIYEAGHRNDMKPDDYAYATLITAWGRSNSKDKAVKAQALFNDKVTRYRLGDNDLRPRVVEYNALAGAWAKSGKPEQAELILRKMESESGIKPDSITYSAVLVGWSRTRHPEAADRMQLLYDEMQRKHLAGDFQVKPNASVFDFLLTAWLESARKDKISKAEAVFKDMLARCESGDSDLKLLVEKYGALFNARPNKKRP
jgi:pentatricopeptide repeat protein